MPAVEEVLHGWYFHPELRGLWPAGVPEWNNSSHLPYWTFMIVRSAPKFALRTQSMKLP